MIAVAVSHCLCWTMVTIMLSTAESTKKHLKLHELYVQEKTAYEKRDHDAVILACNKVLELDSKHFAAYIRRGLAYRMKNNFEEAIADFEAAIRLIGEELGSYNERGFVVTLANYRMVLYYRQLLVDAYIARADIYSLKHDTEQAVADLTKAISQKPKDANLYERRAIVHGANKDYNRAMADCDRSVLFAPHQAESYVLRGSLYLFQADYEHALADFNEAIRRNSQCAQAFYYRGIVYQYLMEHERAIADFETSARLDPQRYEACLRLAQVVFRCNQFTLARKSCDKTESSRPDEYEINTPRFALPIYITPSNRGRIVTIRLFTSEDKGKTWKHEKDYKPCDERIFFTAPHDGRYWFAVQTVLTDGSRNPADLSSLVPAMTVYANFEGKTPKSQNTKEEPKREEQRLRPAIEQAAEKKNKNPEADHKPK